VGKMGRRGDLLRLCRHIGKDGKARKLPRGMATQSAKFTVVNTFKHSRPADPALREGLYSTLATDCGGTAILRTVAIVRRSPSNALVGTAPRHSCDN
jgi:hypothetical protein